MPSYRIPVGHRLGVLLRTAGTLKVTPGAGQLVSNVRVGPTTTSALRVALRADPNRPAPTPETKAPASASADGTDEPGQNAPTETLPATGETTIGLVPLLVACLVLLLRLRARAVTT